MSARELERAGVLAWVGNKQLRVADAAVMMRLSYRQAKRLWKRYRERGAAGLKHGNAGRRSNRAHEEKFQRRVLRPVREKYSGEAGERFGPTLAAEHLWSEDKLRADAETLRQWMLGEGLWSRERKRGKHRQRRERKEHFGEMVQLDGSFHRWLEGRGPEGCLIDLAASGEGGGLSPASAESGGAGSDLPAGERGTIGNDGVVRYRGCFYQVQGQMSVHSKVLVCEGRHGSIGIEYRGRALRFQAIAAPVQPRAVEAKRTELQRKAVAASVRRKAATDHPWKQAAREGALRKTLKLAAGAESRPSLARPCASP
jgi:hypothetical protein